MQKPMTEKVPWVVVVITGDPQLAKHIKAFLDLMLDWEILEWDQLLKTRPLLKGYIDKPIDGGFRLVFGLAEKLERPDKGEKAGFII